jgi:formamidopyrimidine-DNA glycosylase
MPELPEVETIRRDLERHLPGARIAALWTSGKALRLGRHVDTETLAEITVGKRVLGLRRRGKYLLVDTAAGSVVVHLGMTGKLCVTPRTAPRPPHTHVVFTLDRGRELRFTDARRFGFVTAIGRGAEAERELPELRLLGLEPLELTTAALAELARHTRRAAKAFLLDQTRLAGLGNIYVCEALFRAGIHPLARLDRQSAARIDALREAIVGVLSSSIRNRGTTLRDYTDGEGRAGRNQRRLLVYGREGEPCLRCRGPIRRMVQNARSTFFCARCQTRR